MQQKVCWNPENTPKSLHGPLSALSGFYPIYRQEQDLPAGALQVNFSSTEKDGWKAGRQGDVINIEYAFTHHALRAVGAAVSGLFADGREKAESTPFTTLGIMLDCSRNAVMTVDHCRQWLRQLALLGYNMVMLYTEDTYTLPGEPYFGYLRGRYSEDELREIDSCAAELGIEMIGCIQTLGHLARILHWPVYKPVRDTASVLLADDDATYQLIDKMVSAMGRSLSSRRLHIGMDETHDLGRGQFMDRFGYQRGYDIFNRHLSRVIEICHKHGLEPMIWSDMYFRMGSKNNDYYDPACRIPDDVKEAIPSEVDLVYWDYYHEDQAFYANWIERHRELGFEPLMASGVWTWKQFSYYHGKTERAAVSCLRACRQAGLKEVFFTLWGDDGAYCEFDSAMAGLAYMAENAYNDESIDEQSLSSRLGALTGMDYHTLIRASDVNAFCQAPRLLWDDPLMGIYWKEMAAEQDDFWERCAADYDSLERDLAPFKEQVEPVDFGYIHATVDFLRKKIRFRLSAEKACRQSDPLAIAEVEAGIPDLITGLERLLFTFRRQWLRRNKPHGMETIQVRLAGQIERYRELARRFEEWQEEKVGGIAEFDEWPG